MTAVQKRAVKRQLLAAAFTKVPASRDLPDPCSPQTPTSRVASGAFATRTASRASQRCLSCSSLPTNKSMRDGSMRPEADEETGEAEVDGLAGDPWPILHEWGSGEAVRLSEPGADRRKRADRRARAVRAVVEKDAFFTKALRAPEPSPPPRPPPPPLPGPPPLPPSPPAGPPSDRPDRARASVMSSAVRRPLAVFRLKSRRLTVDRRREPDDRPASLVSRAIGR